MYLKYKGKKTNLCLSMQWLIGGPYTFAGHGDSTEVYDDDAARLMQENPLMFDVIESPALTIFTKVPCPECGIEYSSQKGLARHMKAAHGG